MRLPLNAFLLRGGRRPLEAITEASRSYAEWVIHDGDALVPLSGDDNHQLLDAAQPGDVVACILSRTLAASAWQRFIADSLGAPGFGAASRSLGAVIFSAVADPAGNPSPETRWIAWCFGSGSRVLQRRSTDPRFGLLSALNTLARGLDDQNRDEEETTARIPQLRNLQYRTTTPYFQQTGHRAARDIPVEGFRVDRVSDLVSAAGGRTGDDAIVEVLGGRSLRFKTEVTSLNDLVELAEEVMVRYREDRYRSSFGWVDNIALVQDDVTIDELREQLLQSLLSNPIPSTVDALLPDDLVGLDDERTLQYILYPGERRGNASRITLTAEMLGEFVTQHGVDLTGAAVLDLDLRFLDAAGELLGSSSVLECTCADIQVGDAHYIAYDGDFYRVERGFVEGIDAQLRAIASSSIDLRCYPGGHEGRYNRSVAEADAQRFICLDESLIRIPGETPFEPCDLFEISGVFVHVKRKGKSSVLSHLCFQASNSCEALNRSSEARTQLRSLIEARSSNGESVVAANAALDGHENRERRNEVCFAIVGDWRDRDRSSLPLFSKISLVRAARAIEQLGYQPTVALVGQCE